MKDILDPILIQDYFGDFYSACPKCRNHFGLPWEIALAKDKPEAYPCPHCGQLINIKNF